ncbi:hypothetical protein P148_SR1C00001G0932 [candidate division SR1 bacterium RAAC1_SR1_1]|nr:hypothetical protein P148_SR1C00001G0932 [candidate division SR1 bacterium RAAC1_SR1_1]
MINPKEFKQVLREITKNDPNYSEITQEILKNLDQNYLNETEQQNILTSQMKDEIFKMISIKLPEKFNYDRHSFMKQITNALQEKGITLY